MWRPWKVRDITWCGACKQREVNGEDVLCARCQGDLELEIDEVLRRASDG